MLDCVGGTCWEGNATVLNYGGRWVLFGLLGGGDVNGNIFSQLLKKRIRLEASTLRARSDDVKNQEKTILLFINSWNY